MTKGAWQMNVFVRCRVLRILPAILLSAASAWGQDRTSTPGQVAAVDGSSFAASVAAIDQHGAITFRRPDDDRTETLALADLIAWGHAVSPSRGPWIVLADGGLLVGDVAGLEDERLVVLADSFGKIDVPKKRLAGIILDPPMRPEAADRLLDQLLDASDKTDRVIFVNGDEIGGTIRAIDLGTLQCDTPVGLMSIERHRARAILFHRPSRPPPVRTTTHAVWCLRDGSRVAADRATLADGVWTVYPFDGLSWRTAPEKLVGLEVRLGRALYLSDRKPLESRHAPFLELAWPHRTDRSVIGGMLRTSDGLYLKGLGVHGATRLTYAIPPGVTRFHALAALDNSAGVIGSVRYRVYIDGKVKYASPLLRGGQPPVPVDIPLDGASRIDLIVDFGDRGDTLDRANWLRACFLGPSAP